GEPVVAEGRDHHDRERAESGDARHVGPGAVRQRPSDGGPNAARREVAGHGGWHGARENGAIAAKVKEKRPPGAGARGARCGCRETGNPPGPVSSRRAPARRWRGLAWRWLVRGGRDLTWRGLPLGARPATA